jgi:hypothetical protein
VLGSMELFTHMILLTHYIGACKDVEVATHIVVDLDGFRAVMYSTNCLTHNMYVIKS